MTSQARGLTCCAETVYIRPESAILEHVAGKHFRIRRPEKRRQVQAPRIRRKEDAMKVKIEIQEGLEEEEVVIRCSSLNDSVIGLQNLISKQGNGKRCLGLARGETQYYVPVEDLYFLETEGRDIRAHTADQMYECGFRLYELEELLPGNFMRISKSAIVNLDHVYSITRNLTASSEVEFAGSKKKALVSRNYYRALVERLNTKKLGL